MSERLRWRFEASDRVERLRKVSDELDAAIAVKGASKQTCFAARMVVEELVLNAFEHGGAGQVTLEASTDDDPLRLVFEDDGTLFDPTNRSETDDAGAKESLSTRGRGLRMIHVAVQRVEHSSVDGRNRVTVTFALLS